MHHMSHHMPGGRKVRKGRGKVSHVRGKVSRARGKASQEGIVSYARWMKDEHHILVTKLSAARLQ